MFLKELKLKQVFTNLINFPSNTFKLGALDYVYVKELILEKVATIITRNFDRMSIRFKFQYYNRRNIR